MDYTLSASYFGNKSWDDVSVDSQKILIPPKNSSKVTAVLSVPTDMQSGVHQGFIKFEGEHQQDIDVTGGMGLKAARGAKVAQKGIEVMMVSGQHPQRVANTCIGVETRGTKVVSNQ